MSDFHGCAPWDFNCVIAVSGNDQSNASDKQGQQQQRRDVLRPSMLPRKIDSPCREKEAKTTCKDRPVRCPVPDTAFHGRTTVSVIRAVNTIKIRYLGTKSSGPAYAKYRSWRRWLCNQLSGRRMRCPPC